LAQQSPQLYNLPLLHRQMLDVLGIKNAEKLVPMDEDQRPTDPVSENQNVLKGKPVKAFAYQDHKSHIIVHMSAMQDPQVVQLLQNNPAAQALQAAMQAHISEHLGFEYRVQIEQQLGMSLPPQQDESGEEIHMDPEVEARLAPLLAQAAQQLLQQHQGQAAQQQAQQQAQDPLVQMQQQELQLKAQEQARKTQKDQTDAMFKAQQLKVDVLKSVMQSRNQKQMELVNTGADVLKTMSQHNHEKNTQIADQNHDQGKHEANLLAQGLRNTLNRK